MHNDDPPVVDFDPEASKLFQTQFEIDYAAAGPKAPVSGFVYKGIRIESRWSVLAELDTMKQVVDSMSELMARRIATIWCDSKCGSNYVVCVRQGMYVPDLKWAIADAVLLGNGGHNGVLIEEGDEPFVGKKLADIEPNWRETEQDGSTSVNS